MFIITMTPIEFLYLLAELQKTTYHNSYHLDVFIMFIIAMTPI